MPLAQALPVRLRRAGQVQLVPLAQLQVRRQLAQLLARPLVRHPLLLSGCLPLLAAAQSPGLVARAAGQPALEWARTKGLSVALAVLRLAVLLLLLALVVYRWYRLQPDRQGQPTHLGLQRARWW